MSDPTFFGVHTALVTPFTASGEVDFERYEALAHRQLEAGIHGLVPCGTTGETPTLTPEEWEQCITIAVHAARGKVPVTAGVGTNNTRTTVALLERAKALGADAGLLVFPYYNKPNPQGLKAHVTHASDVGLPLVLYHVPGRTGQCLPAALLAELSQMPGVVAVKEATGDIHYGGDLLTQTSTSILSGDDFTFLPLLSIGGSGVISVVSNVAPALTIEVYSKHCSGDVTGAHSALHNLWALIRFLFSDTNPVPCKAAMSAMGLCDAAVRLPLGPYDGPPPLALLRELGLI